METTMVYRGSIGITENRMEATIVCAFGFLLDFGAEWGLGLWIRFQVDWGHDLLGGSWDLVTTSNWAYNRTYNPPSNGLILR